MAANSSWGVFISNITFYLSVIALVLFCINKKEGIHATAVWITYALLAGVIALDSVSEIMLANSNWRSNMEYLGWKIVGRFIFTFLFSSLLYGIVILFTYVCGCGRVFEGSWSDKIGSFSLLVYSFGQSRPRCGSLSGRCCRAFFGWIAQKIGIEEATAKMRCVSKIGMDEGIWKYTFGILQGRASTVNEPDQVKEIYEARGELTLRNSSDELKQYVTAFENDQSVLFWHIATEICYNTDQNLDKNNVLDVDRHYSYTG